MKQHRRSSLIKEDEPNPLTSVANLFDVAMVFALAIMIALITSYNLPEMLDPTASMTVVKNPGKADMQVIIKDGQQIEVMNMTDKLLGGEGEVIGTAYRLSNGKVIYVTGNRTQ